jgi:hypothetical protein
MKRLMLIVPMAALAAAFAQESAKPAEKTVAPLTAEQKAELRRERRERRLAESGGIVERNVQGSSALIVNAAPGAVPMECIDEAAASIRGLVLVKVETATGDPAKSLRPTAEHPVVVAVVNDPSSDTTILVAPEQSWATLNAAPLLRDKPSAEVLASRMHKEIWRASAMAMGAANSMTQPCLLRQINTLRELDHTKNMLPSPQPINNMIEVADRLGIVRIHRATYRRACEEGWAPAPTNDVQKAIWEKVHRLPTEPIKIKPETKKVKE